MRHQIMSHHNTATFLYKIIEAKKRMRLVQMSNTLKKNDIFYFLVTKEMSFWQIKHCFESECGRPASLFIKAK